LLAHRERLAGAVPLALDHHALEDLHAAARALDHLEVNLHAVARGEVRNAAQLGALDCFDDAAHDGLRGGAAGNRELFKRGPRPSAASNGSGPSAGAASTGTRAFFRADALAA